MRKRILVVEDDAVVGPNICQLLEMHGYAAELVQSGPEGIASSEEQSPDLLLCDIWLPGCSGTEVIAHARSAGGTFPIIAMTASPYGPEKRQALKAGADEVLLKPFSFLLLKERIEVLLSALCPPSAPVRQIQGSS